MNTDAQRIATHDLNAAAKLCDAMAATGLLTLIEGTSSRWTCSFHSPDFSVLYTATGETLAAAICEAYLRATGFWKP